MTAITPDLVAEHNLSEEEYRNILEILGREPNLVELGIFSAMWSEHCSYKSSRVHLRKLPDDRAARDPGPGRERRRRGHRRRPRRRVQDGVPQPSVLHRALPGRGDRRGRDPARRLHDGRAADGLAQLPALRAARRAAHEAPRGRRRARDRRLRQLHRHPDARRRDDLPRGLRRQHPRQRHERRHREERSHLPRPRRGRRQPGRLRRLEDGPRRHPRRDDGLRGVRGGRGEPEAADRAGRRSVHREAADGGLPRALPDRRRHRHPGHGSGGPDVVVLRDGRPRRERRRARPLEGAGPRDRHDSLRDHALGVPGADAPRRPARPPRRGLPDLPEVGARRRRDRDRDRLGPRRPLLRGKDRGRPAGRAALRSRSLLRPAARGARRPRRGPSGGRTSPSPPTTATA